MALFGCLGMACAAQLRFVLPGTDVPMTLQPLMMLFIGMTFPVSASAAAMSLYLMCGGFGLPVFAGDGGLGGLTGGYLWGFLLAAPVVGLVSRQSPCGFTRLLLSGLVGMVALLVCGVTWRMIRIGGNMEWALVTGAAPFLAKAVIESALAAGVVSKWKARVGQDRRLGFHGV